MREIRVAIIGTGIIAHQHMNMYKDIPGVTVVAAYPSESAGGLL